MGYITTVNGQLEIKGFDANTNYYLEETKAPDGYYKLGQRVEIAVKDANLEASVSNDTWQSGGVHVANEPGKELPSTGGMGTALFYIGGGVLGRGRCGAVCAEKAQGHRQVTPAQPTAFEPPAAARRQGACPA